MATYLRKLKRTGVTEAAVYSSPTFIRKNLSTIVALSENETQIRKDIATFTQIHLTRPSHHLIFYKACNNHIILALYFHIRLIKLHVCKLLVTGQLTTTLHLINKKECTVVNLFKQLCFLTTYLFIFIVMFF